VRVYLPATTTIARRLLDQRRLDPPLTAFAVTPGLREWYVDDDLDELEYAAMLEAARASLRLIDADPSAARRRVVVALDTPDADVEIRDDLDRGVVRLGAPVPLASVASVHLDEADAQDAVAAAVAAIVEADLGSAHAQDTVDDAEGFELSWYATQELARVLDALA
jgi:uncharacterized protein DUF6912